MRIHQTMARRKIFLFQVKSEYGIHFSVYYTVHIDLCIYLAPLATAIIYIQVILMVAKKFQKKVQK